MALGGNCFVFEVGERKKRQAWQDSCDIAELSVCVAMCPLWFRGWDIELRGLIRAYAYMDVAKQP